MLSLILVLSSLSYTSDIENPFILLNLNFNLHIRWHWGSADSISSQILFLKTEIDSNANYYQTKKTQDHLKLSCITANKIQVVHSLTFLKLSDEWSNHIPPKTEQN